MNKTPSSVGTLEPLSKLRNFFRPTNLGKPQRRALAVGPDTVFASEAVRRGRYTECLREDDVGGCCRVPAKVSETAVASGSFVAEMVKCKVPAMDFKRRLARYPGTLVG